jgi:hypothetical protein
MTADFRPGVELSRRLYAYGVRPLLTRHFPQLAHSAALIGPGSEVLGLDTARSMDHDWGPRMQLFLSPADLAAHGREIDDLLTAELPSEIAGHPTRIGHRHGVVIAELGAWLTERLGFDPRAGIRTRDWLDTHTQALAEVTAGAVHADDSDQLHRVRAGLSWYPEPLWRYVLACQWQRIGQEESFPGRCAEVGDELGSSVVTARLVRDLMRLCLLIERRYPPYSKWLGSAFARTATGAALVPVLRAAMTANDWPERERNLVTAYESIAARHNELGLTPPLDPSVRFYFDRPFRVVEAGRFTRALRESIDDPEIRALPLSGAIDQFVDNTDALTGSTRARADGTRVEHRAAL